MPATDMTRRQFLAGLAGMAAVAVPLLWPPPIPPGQAKRLDCYGDCYSDCYGQRP